MSITYERLHQEVAALEHQLLNVQVTGEIDEDEKEYLVHLTQDIKDIQEEVRRAIYWATMMQIDPDLDDEDMSIDIPASTPLSAETLFGISIDIESFTKQNILLDLVGEILDDSEEAVFGEIIQQYDAGGMESVGKYMKEKNLIQHISSTSGFKYIISQISCGIDLYAAIEFALRECGMDIEKPETQEKIEYPEIILEYTAHLSQLLLSKIESHGSHVYQGNNTLN